MERMMLMVERASLARFSSRDKSIRLLRDSIESADAIAALRDELHAAGVKPLVSLCQQHPWNQSRILLRQDISQVPDKAAILMNSKRLVEQYFVSPANLKSESN